MLRTKLGTKVSKTKPKCSTRPSQNIHHHTNSYCTYGLAKFSNGNNRLWFGVMEEQGDEYSGIKEVIQ